MPLIRLEEIELARAVPSRWTVVTLCMLRTRPMIDPLMSLCSILLSIMPVLVRGKSSVVCSALTLTSNAERTLITLILCYNNRSVLGRFRARRR